MATRTGSFGANNTYQKFIDPVSMGITMQAGEYPVSISLGISSSTGARWQNINYATTLRFTLYLVSDSDWTNYVQLDSWTLAGQGYTFEHNTFNLSATNGKKFTGKTLYLRMQNTNSSTISWDSRDYTCSQHKVTVTVTTAYENYSITCNAGTGGSLTASASTATSGTTITLTPTANTGYQFSSYTTSPSVTITNNKFTMPASNVTVTANFTKKNYTITKAASPSAGGSVSAASSAQYGDQVSVSASASTGYSFSSWSTSPTLTISNGKFTMPAQNVSITANFTKNDYTITKAASPSAGGSVTVAGSAQYGDQVSVSATANTGYTFSSWSTSPTLTISGGKFTMPAQNVTITAKFTKNSYTITKASSPSAGGTVTVAGSAQYGDQVSVSATPATGYQFSSWTTSPTLTISNGKFTMPAQNVTITANFTKKTYTITKGSSPAAGGTVNVASSAQYGSEVTISATPAAGYQFSSWTTTPTLTISGGKFTMPAQNVTITANFTKANYTITKAASPSAGGSVTVASSAQYGDEVSVSATANTGYQFSSWTTSPTLTISNGKFTMPAQNVSITANFTKRTYTITKAVSPSGGGSVTVAGSAQYGSEVTISATASTGYQFSSWTTSPSVTISGGKFTMPASNLTVTANFTKISYAITKASSPSAGGTVNVAANAKYGDQVSITATPATGYQFTSWSTSPSLTISGGKFSMPAQAVSITANFSKITYTITKAASPTAGGTVTAAASAQYGDSVSISQTTNTGYYFNGWTTSPTLTISGGAFTMPAQNVTITARYLKRSTASLSSTTLTGNGTVKLTITTESTAYTHKYKLSFGTNMETSWVSVAAGTTSVTISIPDGWSNYIPSATTKSGGTLVLETYKGSTKIGEYTISSLKYAVRSSAVPTIGTVTKSIARTIGSKTYANVGEYYVQMHSGVRIQTSASGALSSTISSIKVALAGYSGSNYIKTVSSSSIDFTTGLLSVAGTATINITATDSRGRTATKTETITVTAYNAPNAQLVVKRVDSGGSDDDMGEYAKYTITNKRFSAIGTNSLTTKLASPGYSAVTISSDTGDILPGSRKTFNIQQEYAITLTLQDSFEKTTIVGYVRSAKFIIYVNSGGNKLGLMKAATKTIPSGKDSTIEFSANSQIYIGDSTLEDYIRSIVNNM